MFAKKGMFDDGPEDASPPPSTSTSSSSSSSSRPSTSRGGTSTSSPDEESSDVSVSGLRGGGSSSGIAYSGTITGLDDDGSRGELTPQLRSQKMAEQKKLHDAKRKMKGSAPVMTRTHKAETVSGPSTSLSSPSGDSKSPLKPGPSFSRLPTSSSSSSSSGMGMGSSSSSSGITSPTTMTADTSEGVSALLAEREREKDKKTVSLVEQQMIASGISPVFDPVSKKPVITTPAPIRLDFTDMRSFVMNPVPRGITVLCFINRNKKGISNKMYPTYELYLDEEERFLLAAKKRSKNKTSNYVISTEAKTVTKDSTGYVGKLRSNFVGTEFVMYDKGVSPKHVTTDESGVTTAIRQELGSVCYESNIMGSKGPRKMHAIIPLVGKDGIRTPFRPANKEDTMVARLKANELTGLTVLQNKSPKWNEQVGAYVLNFQGRVTMASVKNFQLIQPDEPEAVVLQFGRVNKDTFTMDFTWPLSPMQAFSICLSSFDYKFACE